MHRSMLRLAAVAAGVIIAVPCLAQFQEPTKEELQMTAEPKAPGAKSVYLYVEDQQDDSKSARVFYDRVKILTEKGKESATVRFTHSPDTKFEVEARTIHSDGTVVPLTEKPSDLVEFKTKGLQLNSLVFTLPSAEVGSILEYRVKFKYPGSPPIPDWMVQQEAFIRSEHFMYKPESKDFLSYVSRLGEGLKVSEQKGRYTLDASNVNPVPDEDWMPPLNAFKWQVWFFYSRLKTIKEFWDEAQEHWATAVLQFTEPTGTLKKAVADMVSPGDSETVKAQKIYAAVLKLENTDFTRERTKAERKKEKIKDIHNAQDVWRDQSGNGDEIALLYVALCRAAGLNVVPMAVVDRSRALFDQGLLNSGQMDDYIAVAKLEGKDVFLDPGQKVAPFGVLHWKHTLAGGFRVNGTAAIIEHTPSPSYKTETLLRMADLKIDPSGTVQGSLRWVLQGQQALYWRQMALENDEQEVRKKFNEWIQQYLPEGVQGEFDHFLSLEDYKTNLAAVVNATGTLGTGTGKRFFLPGLFFESKSKHPFVAVEKREIPVDVHYPAFEQDEVTYRLPAGYTLESGPQTGNIAWPQHAARTISTAGSEDKVQVVRKFAYNYTILQSAEYGDLHAFYQKVAAADQQQLILKRAAATSGN